jgi:hypothetical protein
MKIIWISLAALSLFANIGFSRKEEDLPSDYLRKEFHAAHG